MKQRFGIYGLILFLLVSCKVFVLTDKDSENIAVSDSGVANTEISDVIEPYKTELEVSMSQVIGESQLEMTTGSPEGVLGNYVTDLSFAIGNEYCVKLAIEKADFALLNNGGLRTFMPKGKITRGKIYEIMPFENELVVVTLSIKNTVALFEYIGKKTVKDGNRKQGVPVSENVKVMLNGFIPVEVMVNESRLIAKNYRIITTDYLANGGDNMSFFLNPIKYEKLGIKLRDAIMRDVEAKNKSGQLISAQLDKRIEYVE